MPKGDGKKGLVLSTHGCGCSCMCAYAVITDTHTKEMVWESCWVDSLEIAEVNELREETAEACEQFGLTCKLDGHPSDWEGYAKG